MSTLLVAAAALVWLAAPNVALPQSVAAADTLPLAAAVSQALAANPMLRAARPRAGAAQGRVPQAGARPDPELALGPTNRMVGQLGRTMEPMALRQAQLAPQARFFARHAAGVVLMIVAGKVE